MVTTVSNLDGFYPNTYLYLILKQYYELIFHNAIGLKIATA